MSETTQVYLRDLYDHVIQVIEIVETYREMASDLTETYMSSVSNRMNEVMKVLTVITTVFGPLTVIVAGSIAFGIALAGIVAGLRNVR